MTGSKQFRIKLNAIAAADEKMGIGKAGELPWTLKNEMEYFNKMTKKTSLSDKKNVVIMGRKTWESIPAKFRPLRGRLNVVLSKTETKESGDVLFFTSLDEALTELEKRTDIERFWVIGGAALYEESMLHPASHRVYLTEVSGQYDCDTFFPEIPPNFTKLNDHGDEAGDVPMERQEENGITYYFTIYEKQ